LHAADVEPGQVAEALEQAESEVEEVFMTAADRLIQRGVEKGMEKGFEKGTIQDKQEVLCKQLTRKFGVSEEERSFIKSIYDRDKLDCALDEILFAETKKQVLGVLRPLRK
jgi:flagellar biosynthesis/type III secretory pathway protein FliH